MELARQPAARSGRIGRDLRLALPHRKCAATKLSPKYPAVFGGCLPKVINSVRRIKLSLPDACPYKDLFFKAHAALAPP